MQKKTAKEPGSQIKQHISKLLFHIILKIHIFAAAEKLNHASPIMCEYLELAAKDLGACNFEMKPFCQNS